MSLPPDSRRHFAEEDMLSTDLHQKTDAGDFRAAVPLAERVLTARKAVLGNDHHEVAEIEVLLASALDEVGDYDRALALHTHALKIIRRDLEDPHPLLDTELNDFAVHFDYVGEMVQAEILYRESLSVSRRLWGSHSPDVATTINNLADTLQEQGRLREAEPMLREALAIRRRALGEGHPLVAQSWQNLGVTLMELKGLEEAEDALLKSIAIHESIGRESLLDKARALEALAVVNYRKRNYVQADLYSVQASTIQDESLDRKDPRRRRSLINRATILIELGQFDEAARSLDEALEILSLTAPLHPDVAWALRNYGDLELRRHNPRAALAFFERSTAAFEVARSRAGVGSAAARFARSPYPKLAAVQAGFGDWGGAWTSAERYLARTLADTLVPDRHGSASQEDERQEKSLLSRLDQAEARVIERGDGHGSRSLEVTRADLDSLQAQVVRLRQRISATRPLTLGGDFSIERIQRSIAADEALVGWNFVQDGLPSDSAWGYVLRRHGRVTWERLRSEEPGLARPGADFRALVAGGALSAADAGPLFRERLQPLMPHLKGITRLVVLASGDMLGVPVEALRDDRGTLLCDRFSVTYAPSATVLAWLREHPARRRSAPAGSPPRVLVMADPPHNIEQAEQMSHERSSASATGDSSQPDATSGPVPAPITRAALSKENVPTQVGRDVLSGDKESLRRLPRLRSTLVESTVLVRLAATGSEFYTRADCSEQRIRALSETGKLRAFDLLHFGTHAFVDPMNPDRSALILSQVGLPDPLESVGIGTSPIDGVLTAREIANSWSLNADLVTLAGCETGLGEQVEGEGFLGLAHAFLQNGARSALVSLWSVEDSSTAMLIGRFYKTLYSGGGHRRSKTEALTEAKRWLRDLETRPGEYPYRQPYYWAGFILVGDSN